MELGYRAVDADNHYYETLDAFTRHLDPRSSASGACRWCSTAAHSLLLVGGKLYKFIPNPTFDPIIVAGLHRPAVPRPDPRGRRPARRS